MQPTDRDAQIEELRCEIVQLKAAVELLKSALPRDDLGMPDASGHRQYHVGKIRQAATLTQYQSAVTQKILLWGLGAILTLLGAGFWSQLSEKLGIN